MQNNKLFSKMAIVIVSLLFAQCASTRAPSGWLSEPKNVSGDPYGAWVSAETNSGLIAGELIALTIDTMFVADTCLHAVSVSNIRSAQLDFYDPYGIGWMAFVGTLSTMSNGFYSLLTAPMWIIGGSIAAAVRSHEPILDYPDEPLPNFVPYARYPQGLPPGVDRNGIRMKPIPPDTEGGATE